ncbi:MFS transporter [Anaplasma marginale]|uniref:MFS transporter n=1 Tax=Anaplasma marginale TaxID=770 RepID=UPI0011EFB232|nr:MFS transporter [Anaplasma marginale]TZF79273.1 MHS family MFS transporter [Anaplasma marginale]
MYKLWKKITGLNKVVFAVLLCMSIESYDFIVYGMLSSIMAKVFFLQSAFLSDQGDRATYLSSLMGFLVFASAFVARPLGATMFGYLGDRKGRGLALNISAGMLAGSVFLISVLPTPKTWSLAPIALVVLRIIQGLAYGAEVGGVVLMAESVEKHQVKTTWVIGTVFGNVGLFLGAFVLRLCETALTEAQMHEWGWRIPFLVAGVISCALPYLRSRIKESPDYMEYKATGRKENILKSLLQNAGGVLLVFAMGALSSGFFYLSMVYMDLGHKSGTWEYTVLLSLMTLAPCCSLFVSDAGKSRSYFLVLLALVIVAMYPVVHFIYEGHMVARIVFVLIFSIYWGWWGPLVVLIFPVGARQTCFSMPLSMGCTLGGFSPAICLWLSHATGLDGVPAFYLISFAVIVFVMVALFLRVEGGSYKFAFSRRKEGGGGRKWPRLRYLRFFRCGPCF